MSNAWWNGQQITTVAPFNSGNGDVQGETAVRRSLTLRDCDGQVVEALAMVRALIKMTKAGIPESVRIT